MTTFPPSLAISSADNPAKPSNQLSSALAPPTTNATFPSNRLLLMTLRFPRLVDGGCDGLWLVRKHLLRQPTEARRDDGRKTGETQVVRHHSARRVGRL